MILEFLISLLSGFLVKKTDDFADARKRKRAGIAQYAFALLYGAGIAYFIFFTSASSLWLAAFLAMLIVGKIDNKLHYTGALPVLFCLPFFPIPLPPTLLFAFFLTSAALDELEPFKMRPVLPLCALFTSLLTGEWLYFLSIAVFDIGYKMAERI
ncbi:hypothetical protein COV61_02315 [Candidatus Micrarchaeota archaeon CG11_big_fil_rev_8_21_14_0_20_47_5]|nr:MAG: hypothetical protein AUJ17_02755 [Candidatus Micrarchaeota archaeon CG1_02_47_40]PIN83716.1 MAG: hypothetical protein COV61_02315 [Candidatus Micrarchaeota archaeon CG11_big_fil_rev_8_21_14_0_20_47_5]